MTDIVDQYNSARLTQAPAQMLKDAIDEVARLRERLAEADECNRRVSDENETLRRDVRTAVMGDSAELQDVKRENEKLRAALKPFAGYVEQPTQIYEHEGVRMTLVNQDVLMRLCKAAAAAIRESGE